MAELLLEVRCQELPADTVEPLLRRMASRFFEELMSRGLPVREITTGATCRRLAIGLHGLAEREPEREETRLGPAVDEARDDEGRPTEALLAFAARAGVAPEQLGTVRTERGERVAHAERRGGRPIGPILAEMVARHLRELPRAVDGFAGTRAWPRPVTGLLVLLDGRVLGDGQGSASWQGSASRKGSGDLEAEPAPDALPAPDAAPEAVIELDGHRPTAWTVGHAWQSPERFEVDGWQGYVDALAKRGIVLSLRQRAAALARALDARARELGGEWLRDDRLLARSATSLEVPGVVGGTFDPGFLDLPPEMVILALARSQNAFAVRRPGGASTAATGEVEAAVVDLLPAFVVAVDQPPETVSSATVEGYRRAVSGVLTDLRFFVESDRRVPMAERVRRLEQMTFHPRLGTYADKARRLRALVDSVAEFLDGTEELEAAREAATLLDADRTTAVVEAFPALRGVAGGLYAREEGYVESVWQAVYDCRRPHGVDGAVPRHRVGQLLAVADRLATLVGFFGFGALPSGSSDPHGLRRLARGLLRILLDARLAVDLDLLAARAVLLYEDRLDREAPEILRQLSLFLDERSTHLFGQRGFSPDEIAAAKAVGTADLPDLEARLEALRSVRGEAGFRTLVAAAKRISNVVGTAPEVELDPDRLVAEAERELYARTGEVSKVIDEAMADRRYVDVLRHLLSLAPTLDRFFADVLVMAEDEALRANRIALLQTCRRLYWRVARLQAVDPDRPVESRRGQKPSEETRA